MKKLETLRNKEVKSLIFEPFIKMTENMKERNQVLTTYYSYI